MPESQLDLTLTKGADFEQVFVLFDDPRVKQWRGEWHEFFTYNVGEAVELEQGEIFVAIERTMNTRPGDPGSEAFWAPVARLDLTGCTVQLVCESVFTLTEGAGKGITVVPTTGTVTAEAAPVKFAEAPGSATYYLEVKDSGGVTTFPRGGTMIFRPVGSSSDAAPGTAVALGGAPPLLNAWRPGTVYKVTDEVVIAAALWVCITAHTAGLTFESAKWAPVASQKFAEEAAAGAVTTAEGFATSAVGTALATAESFATAAAAGAVTTSEANAAATYIPLSQKGAASGVVPLDGAKLIPTTYLPPLSLTDGNAVASEAAQLALAPEFKVAIRTDQGKSYIRNGGVAGTMADWTEISAIGEVVSVNGHIGTVSLTAADVGADEAGLAAAEKTRALVAEALLIPLAQKNAANGVPMLDANGFVPTSQLPGKVWYIDTGVLASGTDIGPTIQEAYDAGYRRVRIFGGGKVCIKTPVFLDSTEHEGANFEIDGDGVQTKVFIGGKTGSLLPTVPQFPLDPTVAWAFHVCQKRTSWNKETNQVIYSEANRSAGVTGQHLILGAGLFFTIEGGATNKVGLAYTNSASCRAEGTTIYGMKYGFASFGKCEGWTLLWVNANAIGEGGCFLCTPENPKEGTPSLIGGDCTVIIGLEIGFQVECLVWYAEGVRAGYAASCVGGGFHFVECREIELVAHHIEGGSPDPWLFMDRSMVTARGISHGSSNAKNEVEGLLSETLNSAGGEITVLPLLEPTLFPMPTGMIVTLNDGAGHTQKWTTSAPVAVGATTIPVVSQKPSFSFPLKTTKAEAPIIFTSRAVVIEDRDETQHPSLLTIDGMRCYTQLGVEAAGEFQAMIDIVSMNPNSRIVCKGLWNALSISTSTSLVGLISAELHSEGAAITSLPAESVPWSLEPGASITLNDGAGHTQAWVTSAHVAAGATAIPVVSQKPSFSFPAKAKVESLVQLPTQVYLPTAVIVKSEVPAIQEALNAAKAKIQGTSWELTRAHNSQWEVLSSGVALSAPRRLVAPTFVNGPTNDGTPKGSLVNGEFNEYCASCMDDSGNYSTLSAAYNRAATVSGTLHFQINVPTYPCVVRVWKILGKPGTVKTAATAYADVPVGTPENVYYDTGLAINQIPWIEVGVPVPETVAAVNSTWEHIILPGGMCFGWTPTTPEGVVSAPVGSVCVSESTGTVYSKVTGAGNTGWQSVSIGGAESVGTTQLASEAVTTAKVAAKAITAAKIAASAVEAEQIATGAVTEAKLGAEAVTAAKIATGAVTATKLGAEAVTSEKIKGGAVGATQLGSEAVTEVKIAAGAVLTGKLGAEAVTSEKIKGLAVGTAQLAGESVTLGKLGPEAVTAAKIGAAAVEEAKIKAEAVTAAKIAAGAVGTTQLAGESVTLGKLGPESVTAAKIGAAAVEESKIKAEAVTAAKIATAAVTETKLGAEAVTEGKIKKEAVTVSRVKPATVPAAGVTEGELVAGTAGVTRTVRIILTAKNEKAFKKVKHALATEFPTVTAWKMSAKKAVEQVAITKVKPETAEEAEVELTAAPAAKEEIMFVITG